MNLSADIIAMGVLVAIINAIVIGGVGYLIKRVVRASKADTADTIRDEVVKSESRIKVHVDQRFDAIERRQDQHGAAIDGTVRDVTWLYGHLGQTPPGRRSPLLPDGGA